MILQLTFDSNWKAIFDNNGTPDKTLFNITGTYNNANRGQRNKPIDKSKANRILKRWNPAFKVHDITFTKEKP